MGTNYEIAALSWPKIIRQGEQNYEVTKVKIFDYFQFQLEMEIPKELKTSKHARMIFNTTVDSHIYLLAYDKRLTFLRKGNEITKQDIVRDVAVSDDNNFIINFKMNNWHDCSKEEMEYFENGKVKTTKHTNDAFDVYENNDKIGRAHV